MRRPLLIKKLVTLAVLVSLCSALFVTSTEKANAAPAAIETILSGKLRKGRARGTTNVPPKYAAK